MSDDLIAIIACSILGLMAHAARNQVWIEWVIRVTIAIFFFFEWMTIYKADPNAEMLTSAWNYVLLISCAVATIVVLFRPGRVLFSLCFSLVENIVAGRVLLALFGKLSIPVLVSTPSGPPPEEVNVSVQGADAAFEAPAGSAANVSMSSASTEAASELINPTEPSDAEVSSDSGASFNEAAATPSAGSPPESSEPISISEPGKPIESSNDSTVAGSSSLRPPDADAVPPPAQEFVMKKVSFFQAFLAEKVLVPSSIPHMNALWIYITVIFFLLAHTEMSGFQMPSIMIPLPVQMDQLFSYNFLGLILLSICGVGIFVGRKPMESLRRLGIVKPTLAQIGIGIAGIFITFAYDFLWSTFTHGQEGMGYADKLTRYNEGAFAGGGSAGSAAMLASATGICAGFGEEILSRGALQPAFGIVPAAFLHGVLHAQFAHAPMLILQVFGWSMIMGIIRRYTNTTTTIISHVGFNFVSTFLFAFNP